MIIILAHMVKRIKKRGAVAEARTGEGGGIAPFLSVCKGSLGRVVGGPRVGGQVMARRVREGRSRGKSVSRKGREEVEGVVKEGTTLRLSTKPCIRSSWTSPPPLLPTSGRDS